MCQGAGKGLKTRGEQPAIIAALRFDTEGGSAQPPRVAPMLRKSLLIAAVCLAALGGAAGACAFTLEDANLLLQAHTQAFYQVADGRAWFKKTTDRGKADFWKRAELMEMELDAYERTSNVLQLAMFTNLFRGFIADHGADWSKNEFNDDIMWMVIACARGYLLTGDPEFRDAARHNFDACFARAWSSDLDGGLWWKTDNKSKNACVNGPAAIAAALLSRACREPAYLTKATNVFLWERAKLFDPETGRVSDNIRPGGRKQGTAFSYNQGTFVGAANLLGFTNEAMLAATYTMNNLGHDGLLPSYNETGDSGGFNGICVRWIARFMNERCAQPTFESWLQKNADAAWGVRRTTDNLSWCRWHDPTPLGERDAWGCSSSVVILQVVRPTASLKQEKAK
jgi:predicted alpha-1,6-mannanase (GH76 family)